MQTRDEVEGLHNCLEFSQLLSCLYQAMQTRKTFSIAYLYSWRFSRYSAPTHWLVHGHMTSSNETVSRQMP